MVEGRDRQLWVHTSSLMALFANVNRSKKNRVLRAAEFNPYVKGGRRGGIPVSAHNIGVLKGLLPGRGKEQR